MEQDLDLDVWTYHQLHLKKKASSPSALASLQTPPKA
jgi:hypothetical protein